MNVTYLTFHLRFNLLFFFPDSECQAEADGTAASPEGREDRGPRDSTAACAGHQDGAHHRPWALQLRFSRDKHQQFSITVQVISC